MIDTVELPTAAHAWRADLIDEIGIATRQRARADAAEVRLFADLLALAREEAGDRSDDALEQRLRQAAAEIGIVTNISDRTIMRRFDEAHRLVDEYPEVLAALTEATITLQHARTIMSEGDVLGDAEARGEYARRALEVAERTTAGRLKLRARRIAAELDGAATATRLEQERRRRFVQVFDLADGMSELVAYLPSPVAAAIHDRLTELAKSTERVDAFGALAPDRVDCRVCENGFVRVAAALTPEADLEWAPCPSCFDSRATVPGASFGVRAKHLADGSAESAGPEPTNTHALPDSLTLADGETPAPRDPRSFDAIRADALADLLLAGVVPEDSRHAGVNAIQGRISVTVPALTLTGANDEPAFLDGVGPIPVDVAMRIAAGATIWQRVLTDPLTGEAVAADTYRPSAELRRFIETRDQHCRAPGCRRPAQRCDLDHTREWAKGGTTTADNLAALCRYHHVIRHHGWDLHQVERGELAWMSPCGIVYRDRPPRIAKIWTPAEVRALLEASPPHERPPEGPAFRPSD